MGCSIVVHMSFKIRLKTIRTTVIGLTLVVIGAGFGYYFGKGELMVEKKNGLPKLVVNASVPSEYQEVDFSLFWEVWRMLDQEYLDQEKIDPENMVYGAIEGMVSALGDPYTVFLPPAEQQRTNEDLSGAFEGVGIQLGYRDEQLAVIAPLKGMPAEAAGVQAGDWILNIKDDEKGVDIETGGLSLPEAVAYIRGEHGKPVTLTLYRDGEPRPFDVVLARDTIVVPSVELEFVDAKDGSGQKVAHLSLHKFGGRTDDEWNDAVGKILLEKNLAGVVLDLRNNPGGYLNGAVFVASEFIDDGVVVQQQGRYETETFSVNRRGRLLDIPVVVMVNRGSASASEIVAGALRDRRDSLLVGQRSFGKGTVQSADDLRGGTGVHITIARWLLPSGSWIHEDGLEPDVEATPSAELIEEGVDNVLDVAVDTLIDNY